MSLQQLWNKLFLCYLNCTFWNTSHVFIPCFQGARCSCNLLKWSEPPLQSQLVHIIHVFKAHAAQYTVYCNDQVHGLDIKWVKNAAKVCRKLKNLQKKYKITSKESKAWLRLSKVQHMRNDWGYSVLFQTFAFEVLFANVQLLSILKCENRDGWLFG